MKVYDEVLDALGRELGAHPPERGGALLGLRGHALVTCFLPDPDAHCTAVSYRPSRHLAALVEQTEREAGLELKGIVHSHPGHLDRPSAQDECEVATGLALNGHLGVYLCPIVTQQVPDPGASHQIEIEGGKATFYAGWRARSGRARIEPLAVTVLPIRRDVARLAARLGAKSTQGLGPVDLEGCPLVAYRLTLPGRAELLVLFSEHYPLAAPIVLRTGRTGRTRQLGLDWRVEMPAPERLVQGVVRAFVPGRRRRCRRRLQQLRPAQPGVKE